MWSQTQVFLNGQILLLHNKSAWQEYFLKNCRLFVWFFLGGGKFNALKFWRKQIWRGIWFFGKKLKLFYKKKEKKKNLVGPAH